MLVKELQAKNTQFPMYITELGMMALINSLQPEKAPFPICVTEFGIVIIVKLRQRWDALSQITCVPGLMLKWDA